MAQMRKYSENETCHAPYIEALFQKSNIKYLCIKGSPLREEVPRESLFAVQRISATIQNRSLRAKLILPDTTHN